MSKPREPKSAHKIVSLTLTAVGAACFIASTVVDRLERDKQSTAAHLADVDKRPDKSDVETPAAAAAGDPAPPVEPEE